MMRPTVLARLGGAASRPPHTRGLALARLIFPLVVCLCAAGARAEPDEALLGKERGYPVGDAASWYGNPFRVGSWSAMDRVRGLPTRSVPRGDTVTPLPQSASAPPIRYRFRGQALSLDDYLERQRITGLLVLRHGEIVAERYRYGRDEQSRFLSFSMAKTVTALLLGIALERGAVASLDEPAERYASELAGSAYGATRIGDLLRMGSGLTFTERYDGRDDVARMSRAAATGRPPVVEVLRSIGERHAPAGSRFVYASAETEVLGRVLRGATGRSLADLSSQWLWQPLGAERDAFWVVGHDGQERASGYFNASLRDWGRLGLLLAQDGRMADRQIVPRQYLLDATDPARQPEAFRPRQATPYFGYGYQTWIFPMRERSFGLQGVHGQAVFVQPATGIVMVQTAVLEGASGQQDPLPGQERDAFWRGVLASLGGRPD